VVSPSDAVFVVSIIGTTAFALSGVMAATEAGMDWLGGVVLAAVAAIGGGTLRDLLLGETPMFWVGDEWPLFVALGTAVGLGAFVVVGTSVALDAGTSYFIAVAMGVITGVGGGVLRDVLARRTPIVLVGEIYAVAGLIGAVVHLMLVEAGAGDVAAIWIPLAVVVVVRAAAVRWSWHLPRLGRD
jgi:uncharacterized membrane protein YeiH